MRYVLGVILCTTASAGLISAAVLLIIPRSAGASWPFSISNAETIQAPVLHDPSLNLLAAPLSTNVDDLVESTALTTPDGTAIVPGGDSVISGSAVIVPADTGDSITTPTSGTISQYTVKAGDSLSEIAQSFGVSVNTILWANNIKDPSTIKQGTVLVILPVSGIEHTVRSGETLSSIAAKFGADAGDIAQFNGISADGALSAGSVIIIPGGELPSSSSSQGSSQSSKTKSSTSGSSSLSKHSSSKSSSGSNSSGKTNYSDETNNPYKGGSGAALHGFFSNPLPGALLTQSIHGWNAVDLGDPTGTPIRAAAKGTVILSRMGGWNGGYGNYVIIDNGSGVETLYAHMSQTKASTGDSVSSGEVIGYVGTSGEATGPHLHFEVRGARNPFASCVEMQVCSPE